jgi:CoA-transferase family III
MPGVTDAVSAWASSGALSLTGPPDGPPLGPPSDLLPRLAEVVSILSRWVAVDPLSALTARAAIAGLTRGGRVSCGGGTRLLPTADGWLAVSLARPDDVDLIPAWLGTDSPAGDPWPVVRDAAARAATEELVARGVLLGLPIAALPPDPPPALRPPEPLAPLPHRATRLGDARPAGPGDVLVVELASLWAGPLCGSLLARAGARVVKVESSRRPDGARLGPGAFFDLLNAGKRSVALDVATSQGRDDLATLIAGADVVIEGSRPRALAQLGIDPTTAGTRVWVSITGHGRTGPGADRVAFGDDAAVAGGLVAWDGPRPYFCADAVADPATGLVAAAACVDALAAGGRWLLDVAMAGVAADLAGPTLPVPAGTPAPPPVAPPPPGRAPALGEDTDRVLLSVRRRRRRR